MGIQFKDPWYLLLLVPVAGYVLWSWKNATRLSGLRKTTAFLLRLLICCLLVFSLAGLQWFVSLQQRAVVYVLDRSESMPDPSVYEPWLKESAQWKSKDDLIGVAAAGLDGAVERSLSVSDLSAVRLDSQVNGRFTNLANGLQLASGLLPADASSRIVLVTDGLENTGDALKQARLLKDKGIPVDILTLPPTARKDAAIESFKLPEKLYQAESYSFELQINSTFSGTGELRIYEDNAEISRLEVAVERGENRFSLQGLAREPGFHRYRAEIYFAEDEVSANNASYAFSRVSGPAKVLIVEGAPGSSANLEAVMDSGFIQYEVIPPEMLSREMADYQAYDSIILNNVPATRMSQMQMEMIEQAVRDYGIGLVMAGGEDSYGLGGYFQTPIERALPVKMELEGKRELPSLGLILVIDRSGSMDGGKMELAKEAAMRTVELLRDQDTVGVVAFDSYPWWVVEPTPLTDREQVLEQIQSIQPAGGTEIYTAVEAAYQRMLEVDAQRKHIILLTDGQSATNMGYQTLMTDIVNNHITLSSVAVGSGADVRLLESLAQMGNGRYYFTDDQSTLPAIFSREAVMISRTYIVNQTFVPAMGQLGDWAGLFAAGIPPIDAYVAVTAKPSAEVGLSSPEPDPLLARWQYGSGRAVAWTSDVTGKWSGQWVSWSQFPHVFSQIVKWTFPQFEDAPFELTAKLEGSEVKLSVQSGDADFKGSVKAVVTDERLQTSELQAVPVAPGQFEAAMNVSEPGVYLTRLDFLKEDQPAGSTTTGFVIPYSPEYRIQTGDPSARLKQLAELTGGRMLSLDRPEEVFQGEVPPKRQLHPLSRPLLMAALLLWLADIAVRRLSLPWERLAALPKQLLRRRSAVTAASAAGEGDKPGIERLQQRKRRAGAFYAPASEAPAGGASSLQERGRDEASPPPAPPEVRTPQADDSRPAGVEEAAAGNAETEASRERKETMNRLLAAKNRRKR